MNQPVWVDAALDQGGDGPAEIGPQCRIGLGDRIAKRGIGTIRAPRHARPLRAVAGKDKSELALAQRGAGHDGSFVA